MPGAGSTPSRPGVPLKLKHAANGPAEASTTDGASNRIDTFGPERRGRGGRRQKTDQRLGGVHVFGAAAQTRGKSDTRLKLVRYGTDQICAGNVGDSGCNDADHI